LASRAKKTSSKKAGKVSDPIQKDQPSPVINRRAVKAKAASPSPALVMIEELERLLQLQQSGAADEASSADTLSTLAELCRLNGYGERAEIYFRRALAVRSLYLGKDHASTAHSAFAVAELSCNSTDLNDAEQILRFCLESNVRRAGPQGGEVPALLDKLKRVLEREKKDSAEAERFMAATVYNAVNDALEVFPVDFYKEWGKELLAHKQYKQAEVLFCCLRDVVLALSPDCLHLAQILQLLALSLAGQGKKPNAVRVQNKALIKFEQLLGPNHPEVGRCLGRLADLQFANGEYKQALFSAERARSLLQLALGKDDAETVTARNRIKRYKFKLQTKLNTRRISSARAQVELLTEKVEAERQAQKRRNAAAQPVESTTAIETSTDRAPAAASRESLANLVQSELDQAALVFPEMTDKLSVFLWEKTMSAGRQAAQVGNEKEAERMFSLAMEKARHFGENSSRLWDSMCELSSLYSSTGKLYKAAQLYQQVIVSCEKTCGTNSLQLVPYLFQLAQNYSAEGELLKEKKIIQRIIQLYVDAGAPDYQLAPYKERLLALSRELTEV